MTLQRLTILHICTVPARDENTDPASQQRLQDNGADDYSTVTRVEQGIEMILLKSQDTVLR